MKTLPFCVTVAVVPPPFVSEPLVTLYEYVSGAPSGSVAVTVTTVAAPSVDRVNGAVPLLPSCTLLIVGPVFDCTVTPYHVAPFQMNNPFVYVMNAIAPVLLPVIGRSLMLVYAVTP